MLLKEDLNLILKELYQLNIRITKVKISDSMRERFYKRFIKNNLKQIKLVETLLIKY